MIVINARLTIPEEEVRFTFSRSGGPGGQNVNKVNTRVTLWFDLEASPSLTLEQKDRIRRRLAPRINKNGVLRVDASGFRTQLANREDALNRFVSLMAGALKEKRKRKKTKIPKGVKERRLQAKKQRGLVKKARARSKKSGLNGE